MITGEDELCYTLVLSAEEVFKKKIVIDYSAEKYGRTCGHEEEIEESWQKALSSKARIFNATKYRLFLPILVQEHSVTIRIGLTDYREYLGTNRSDSLALLKEEGKTRFDDENAFLSNAIGCEALLLTSDNYLLLLRRSYSVATHTGLYNGPSGHAEPSRVNSQHEKELLRDSILLEITQETGLEANLLSEPQLIGIMLDSFSKPDFIFLVNCQADCTTITSAAKHAVESWESDHFLFLPLASALDAKDAASISLVIGDLSPSTILVPLTPVTQAALRCLRAHYNLINK
mmetsp:Transcript_15636/g.20666  ORF Transcript_15636/g.20666 Transcript_15636/m.20666 type:complete len:289 (+) Transcript_15636:1995-2861(+)